MLTADRWVGKGGSQHLQKCMTEHSGVTEIFYIFTVMVILWYTSIKIHQVI